MSISVLGIGTVSALGNGITTLKSGLEGKTKPVIKERKIKTAEGEISLPVYTPEIKGLERFIPRPAALRRTDRFMKMALLSSYLAIEDSGIELKDNTRIGIVFGTGYGSLQTTFDFLDSLIDYGDKCASPTLFTNSVHNSLVAQVAIALKIQGPSLTLTCFEETTSAVFSTAMDWLRRDVVDYVITGVGDEYCDVRGYGTSLSGAKNVTAIRPFKFDECTYIPGEGFVVFLLGREPGKNSYAWLKDVKTGRIDTVISDIPEVLFLAAKGEKSDGQYYKQLLTEGRKIGAYSPLFGAMPVGNGFDIAIAALSLKEGRLYPVPDTSGLSDHNLLALPGPLTNNASICCIQHHANDNYCLITLGQ